MDWTLLNLNTFIPEMPQIIDNNFASFKRYLDIIYNETSGVVVVPVNTTGRVKAATGEFVNVIVDNLTVKKQYTNLLSNNTTADLDYYNTYWGLDASVRDASTIAWESAPFKYIDTISPYYKIKNDVSVAFNTDTLGQVVEILFDISTAASFNIRCSSTQKIVVTAANAPTTWLQLICIKDDPSLGNTWIVKQYAGTYSITTW
jgi:membrane-associated protease RseP (regulator of RpoE activity)